MHLTSKMFQLMLSTCHDYNLINICPNQVHDNHNYHKKIQIGQIFYLGMISVMDFRKEVCEMTRIGQNNTVLAPLFYPEHQCSLNEDAMVKAPFLFHPCLLLTKFHTNSLLKSGIMLPEKNY